MVIYDIVPYGDEINVPWRPDDTVNCTYTVPDSFHSMGRGNCMASIGLRGKKKAQK